MAVFVREDGISVSTSDVAPCHFLFQVRSVSVLSRNNVEKYTTAHFEAGGYKWKLIFYPNGNKHKNITDHVSMYLTLADTSGFLRGWEVHVVFRLFLLDQSTDSYLVLRDAHEKGGKRFRATKMEWGYDKVVSLKTFIDPSYGYVVNDECVFGAEVYVRKEFKFPKGEFRFPKGESFSMIKEPIPTKYSWKIKNFFGKNFHESETFRQWKMQIYPIGKGSGEGSHLSLYLVWKPEDLDPPSKIYTEIVLRVIDKQTRKNHNVTATCWFSSTRRIFERPRLISTGYFKTQAAGFLTKGGCTIEVELNVRGETKPLLR